MNLLYQKCALPVGFLKRANNCIVYGTKSLSQFLVTLVTGIVVLMTLCGTSESEVDALMPFVYKNMKYPAPELMVIEGFMHHSDWATWKDVFKGCNELKFNLL